MKIVVVIDIYDLQTNGTVMTAYRFVEELKKRGHVVNVVATGAKGDNCYEVDERYIPLVSDVAKLQQIRFAKPDEKTLIKAFEGADIIHFYLPFKLEIKGKKIADRLGIPSTAAFHLQPENVTYNAGPLRYIKFLNKYIYKRFKRRFYKNFNHIHCPSEFIASQLKKNRYKAKLHVISNGVDTSFKPLPSPKEVDMNHYNILMIGRFATEKRQDLIIKAISESKYSDKIHLTLAGKGPKRKKLEKLGKKYLKNPITFGFYNEEELIKVIHNQDLYIHSADVEIEAIACIEAFSCGLVPIISDSKRSATSQFALDDRSKFKAGDYVDLAKKIDYWIEHEEEKKKQSMAYVEASKKYTLHESIIKAEEMFNEEIDEYKEAKKKMN